MNILAFMQFFINIIESESLNKKMSLDQRETRYISILNA